MKKGFTLIEMLVVIGIIVILIGASIGGYSKMTKSAERAKAQELVANVATALTVYFQQEGCWPNRILTEGKTDGLMNENIALILSKKGLFSVTTGNDGKPDGVDQFGILTPWAAQALKRAGKSGSKSTKVTGSQTKVEDHILHFAVDIDGDGIINGASVGGEAVDIRATAAVWCIGKSGGDKGKPWPYKQGRKKDDLYSFSYGQTQNVR